MSTEMWAMSSHIFVELFRRYFFVNFDEKQNHKKTLELLQFNCILARKIHFYFTELIDNKAYLARSRSSAIVQTARICLRTSI